MSELYLVIPECIGTSHNKDRAIDEALRLARLNPQHNYLIFKLIGQTHVERKFTYRPEEDQGETP